MTTTTPPTTEQIRAAWDALAPRYDRFTTPEDMPFGDYALNRLDLRPGTRFLDVACGSGALAIPAARRGADVVAVDLAPTMIERLLARAGAEGLTTIEGHVMNGTALDLPDDSFDACASQNGVSLFPDLDAGLRELVRVAKPGGRVMIVAFGAPQNVEFLVFALHALKAAVPGFVPIPLDPPPPPMQLADPAEFGRRLSEAGLTDVLVEPATWDMPFHSADHFWDVVTSSNPIAVELTSGLSDDEAAQARQVIDGMLRERSGGEQGAVLQAGMNIGVGTKPGSTV